MRLRLVVHDEGERLLVRVYRETGVVAEVALTGAEALGLVRDLLAAGLRHIGRRPA